MGMLRHVIFGVLPLTASNYEPIVRKMGKDLMFTPLAELDPAVTEIIKLETQRQEESIVLIASENFTSKAVMQGM